MREPVPNPFEVLYQKLDEIAVELRALRKRLDDPATKDVIGGVELASSVLGLAPRTIYKLTHRRAIPHLKRGGRLYFKKSELEEWLQAGRRPTAIEEAHAIMQGRR